MMTRDTASGEVVFNCFCGVQAKGGAADARVAGGVLDAAETGEMYERLIRNAPFDRVNQQVARDCPGCGLDYMTQIRVGAREVVVWVCKCGYNSTADKSAKAEKPPAGRAEPPAGDEAADLSSADLAASPPGSSSAASS